MCQIPPETDAEQPQHEQIQYDSRHECCREGGHGVIKPAGERLREKASPQKNRSAAEQRHAEPPEGFQAERCPPVQDGKVDRSGARSGQKHGKQVAVNAER
mgnify:FL=1